MRRYNVIDDSKVQCLLEIQGFPIRAQTRLNIAPSAKGQIVYETNQGRTLEHVIWSLLIEPKPDGTGTSVTKVQHLQRPQCHSLS